MLTGIDRKVLSLRPGITGPASLKYSNEEELLALQEDPIAYNNEVIFPDNTICNSKSVQGHSGIMPMNRNVKANRVSEDWTNTFLQSV